MHQYFSLPQQKALSKIWILAIITFTLLCAQYYVNVYTVDTVANIFIYNVLDWAIFSTVLCWYFYRNKRMTSAIILQALLLPYYVFRNSIAQYVDYNFDLADTYIIYRIFHFIFFLFPLLYFTLAYFRTERRAGSELIKKAWKFIVVIVLFFVLNADAESFSDYIPFLNFSSPLAQDIFGVVMSGLSTLKLLFLLVGFFYVSNRLKHRRSFYLIEPHFISAKFFSWGFLISFFILLVMLIDLAGTILSLSVFSARKLAAADIVQYLSAMIAIFIAGRFLGQLIQSRNYSLKKYFGVVNSMSLLPLFNLLPYFVLRFSKTSSKSTSEYIHGIRRKKLIHLSIYIAIVIAFRLYDYYKTEYRETEKLWHTLLYIGAILLVANFRKAVWWIPIVIVGVLYFDNLKKFFDFSDGFLPFFKNNVLSFVWLGTVALLVIYYVVYYVLHKSFYTSFFERKDFDEFTVEVDEFNKVQTESSSEIAAAQ